MYNAGVGPDVPVGNWLSVESGIDYVNHASNQPAADFREFRYSPKLAVAF